MQRYARFALGFRCNKGRKCCFQLSRNTLDVLSNSCIKAIDSIGKRVIGRNARRRFFLDQFQSLYLVLCVVLHQCGQDVVRQIMQVVDEAHKPIKPICGGSQPEVPDIYEKRAQIFENTKLAISR